tara:strand:+ start:2550 stop:4142 length:1593 start_codon:yes stop_codon:yes gene_type:complete
MQTATNPDTGEKVYWNGESWVPLETATNPNTGERVGFVNGKWTRLSKPAEEYATRMEGFMERVPQKIESGRQEYAKRVEALDPLENPLVPFAAEVTSGVATTALTAGDIITDYMISSVPNSVRKGAEAAFNKIKDADWFKEAMRFAEMGIDKYNEWKTQNPGREALVDNTIDLSVLFSPRPDLNIDVLERRARGKSTKLNIEEFREGVRTLIKPESFGTTDVVEEVGTLRSQRWIPDEKSEEIIGVLETTPNVDPNRSYTYNMNAVLTHIGNQAEELEKFIKKAGNPKVDANDLVAEMSEALEEFKASAGFRGITPESQKIVLELANDALGLVQRYGNDAMGILKARKEFDRLMNEAYVGVLDSASATGRAKATRVVREVLNEKLKQITPGDEAHHLLNHQHNSYLALDRMVNKRNKELDNSLKRVAQRLKDAALLPSTLGSLYFTGTAVAGVVGGAGPALAAGTAGAALYGGVKLLSKTNRAKMFAETLKALNTLIKKSDDPNVLYQLKADRLIILDLMQQEQESEEDE